MTGTLRRGPASCSSWQRPSVGILPHGSPLREKVTLPATDHTLHRYWVQPGVHTYFTAIDTMADGVRRRLPGARVHAAGIPVDPDLQHADSAATRRELCLAPDRPIALLVGGGLGIGVEDSIDAALAGLPESVQLVAVFGRNDEARERLTARPTPRSPSPPRP